MVFQIGDVVKLKSGGPKMTVESMDNDGVKCVWFDKADSKAAIFPEGTLARLPSKGRTTVVRLVR
jgi:uncharacterized protein YodC (DUF2158 family)